MGNKFSAGTRRASRVPSTEGAGHSEGAYGDKSEWALMPVLSKEDACTRCLAKFNVKNNSSDSCRCHVDSEGKDPICFHGVLVSDACLHRDGWKVQRDGGHRRTHQHTCSAEMLDLLSQSLRVGSWVFRAAAYLQGAHAVHSSRVQPPGRY